MIPVGTAGRLVSSIVDEHGDQHDYGFYAARIAEHDAADCLALAGPAAYDLPLPAGVYEAALAHVIRLEGEGNMTSTAPHSFRDCDVDTLLAQIGRGQIMAISGLRVTRRSTGVTLPVNRDYAVTVDYDVSDTYTVRRLCRGRVVGELAGCYDDMVGEAAYQASCFNNGDWHPVAA